MATLNVTHDLLDLAARRYGFALPDKGLVFFGIRGAFPDSPAAFEFAPARLATIGQVNHLEANCSIGQWDRGSRLVALFPGSTAPSMGSIAAAKARGGAGANMLLPGRYEYAVGVHKAGQPSGHPAFRQSCFFPVRRTANDTAYDNFDRIDFGSSAGDFVADNLHSAYHDLPDRRFSSAGCQVVSGLPSSPSRGGARETGAWRAFKDNAYTRAQQRFVYLLFTGMELAQLAASDADELRQIVRFGSGGEAARLVQQALIGLGDLAGTADGDFGRSSAMALASFQKRVLGPDAVDATCGAATAAALRIELPPVVGAAAPRAPAPTEPDAVVVDLPDETDIGAAALRDALQRAGLTRFVNAINGAERTPTLARQAFFDACRRSLFDGVLRESQVRGVSDVLDVWEQKVPDGDPRWLAYILASIYHETGGRMVPVREGFKDTDEAARLHVRKLFEAGKIKRDYAAPVNGISYFGRGRVQVTHFDNYQRCAKRFDRDFVHEPNLLLDSRIDAPVAVFGHIEGLWTGVKLADFIKGSRCDYVAARRIVNGQDRAEEIARFARIFETAVRAGLAAAPDGADARPTVDPNPATPSNADAEQAGDKLMSAEADIINRRIDSLEAKLTRFAMAQPDPATAGSGVSAGAGGVDSEEIRAIKGIVAELVARNPKLAPVNNALGAGLGNLLSGKKTAVGLVGSVLATMFEKAPAGGVLDQLAGVATKALPALGGLSGPLLPVFLAVTAWGFLGKQEKWNLGELVARQTPPQ